MEGVKMYSTGEAARILGFHPYTIAKWIREGKIKAVKVGRIHRIPEYEIKRILGEDVYNKITKEVKKEGG